MHMNWLLKRYVKFSTADYFLVNETIDFQNSRDLKICFDLIFSLS